MRLFYGSEDTPNWRPLPIKEVANGGRMDDQEFKRKLSEVADWKIPENLQETSNNAKKKRGRKSAEEQYQEAHEEIFLEMFDGVNPTHAPLLLKVKCRPTTCEDCGNHCPNGRKKEKKLYKTGKDEKRNWRERCVTCELHQNPFTGKFELNSTEASHVWTDWLRDRKGEYKSRYARAKDAISLRMNESSIETDTGVITYYPDSKSEK